MRPSEWPVIPSSPKDNSTRYPPYCDGPVYLFSPTVARGIMRAYDRLRPRPFFWLEDIFVTGVLSRMAGVPLRPALTPQVH